MAVALAHCCALVDVLLLLFASYFEDSQFLAHLTLFLPAVSRFTE